VGEASGPPDGCDGDADDAVGALGSGEPGSDSLGDIEVVEEVGPPPFAPEEDETGELELIDPGRAVDAVLEELGTSTEDDGGDWLWLAVEAEAELEASLIVLAVDEELDGLEALDVDEDELSELWEVPWLEDMEFEIELALASELVAVTGEDDIWLSEAETELEESTDGLELELELTAMTDELDVRMSLETDETPKLAKDEALEVGAAEDADEEDDAPPPLDRGQ